MHIAIYSHAGDDLAGIARSLPGHDCRSLALASDLPRLAPHLLIIDMHSAAEQLDPLLAAAAAMPVLLLTADQPAELATLNRVLQTHSQPRLLGIEFKPWQRHALAARVRLLLQLAYPNHNQNPTQQFGDYRFEPATHSVAHARWRVRLTHKEFALALLLFSHLGQPLSRAYLQESIWENDPDTATRTIDTHIARLRSKLQLKPDHGYRLATVYGYGYQLERLSPT